MPPRDVKLSPNFSLAEFTSSSTAAAKGIDNTPDATATRALQRLVAEILQPLREQLDRPVRITSGFRSRALNQTIGGAVGSQHERGEAADIKVEGYSAEQLATAIVELGLPFDQVIWYTEELGGHVHVSHRASGNREEALRCRRRQGVKRYDPWAPTAAAA